MIMIHVPLRHYLSVLYSEAECLVFGLILYLLSYFLIVNDEGLARLCMHQYNQANLAQF